MNYLLARIRCCATLLCISFFSFSAVSASPADIPLEDFFRHAEFTGVALSPSGEYIAVTVPAEGRRNLAILDISDLESISVKSAFELRGGESPFAVRWVTPDRLIFETTIQVGALEVPARTGRVFSMNADGSNRRQLFGTNPGSYVFRQMSVIHLLPEQPDWILIQHWAHDRLKPIAERLNVNDARLRTVASSPLNRGGLMADRNGEVRFAYGTNDDDKGEFAWRPSVDAPWQTFENTLGESISPIAFNDEGDGVYFSVRRNQGSGLWLARFNEGDAIPIANEHGVEIDHPVFSDVSPYKYDASGRNLLGVRFSPGYPIMHILDADATESQWLEQIGAMFDGNYVHFHNWTADGKRAIVSVASDQAPREFFLLDTEAPALRFIAGSRGWIDPAQMSPMQPISFTARDDLQIHGYMTTPQNQEPNPDLPFVVYIHGGPHGVRDYWTFDPVTQLLASRGFGVLQVNFRGSGGYGWEFERKGYRQWGAKMQDDITDATHWLIEQGYADPERICIAGASYGGFSTLSGIVREPDLYACAFAFVGVYDLALMKEVGDIPETAYGRNYLNRVLGNNEELLARRSPTNHVENIKTPLFIAHGGEDIRAHVDHYHLLKKRLDEHNIPYEELLVEDEGHGFYKVENNVKLYERVLEFMLKHTAKDE
ncbi:S9 family peptidase [Aliidiomarina halalkaliphila]|uniref:S9 family peptidase n=1 Tax=Aliidiomarina halalkaliphila TaxID=2593535 RepID=A0A552WZ83_9GAMM|nr:S9 family peptidase [Aliidiomarina halalkaliphila]TRW48128.1 S9 family peptidase [Aliidiomarina halalkaliphila]